MKLPVAGRFISQLPELLDRQRLQKFSSNIGFGTIGSPENVRGIMLSTGVSPGTPDTEFSVAHNLGYIPVGYLNFGSDKAGSLYKGTTAWTSTLAYFKCNQASVTFTVFIH